MHRMPMNREPKKYRVIEVYTSPYPNPIIFHQGEVVEVGREFNEDPDWRDWVWCESASGARAWVPKQYLDGAPGKATFIRDYNAMELSVREGEELILHEIVNGFGMAEKPDGRRGWVPMRNLERMACPDCSSREGG